MKDCYSQKNTFMFNGMIGPWPNAENYWMVQHILKVKNIVYKKTISQKSFLKAQCLFCVRYMLHKLKKELVVI